MEELDGKVLFITGASSGIGSAAAKVAFREGALLALNYHEHEGGIKELLEGRDGEARVFSIKGDVTRSDNVKAMVGSVIKKFGKIDVLINNAGGLPERRPFLQTDTEYWDKLLGINLRSAYIVTREILPGMVQRGGGVIINISSIAAVAGGGMGASAYATAKGGLATFSRALAKEFGTKGIRAISVLPGLIDTPFHEKAGTKDLNEWVKRSVMLGRVGRAEEVGELISFLSSDRASYITGVSIQIDGGWVY